MAVTANSYAPKSASVTAANVTSVVFGSNVTRVFVTSASALRLYYGIADAGAVSATDYLLIPAGMAWPITQGGPVPSVSSDSGTVTATLLGIP